MATTSIKYKVPKLIYSTPASFPQTYKLEIKLKGSPDSSYAVLTESYVTDVNGNNSNNYSFSTVAPNATYVLRFTNAGDVTKIFTVEFTTAINLSVGASPYVDKIYYKGQTVDWYYPGLLSQTLPATNGGFFFTWDNNYREIVGDRGNMVPTEGTVFKLAQDAGQPLRKMQGLYFDGTNSVAFNNVNASRPGQIRANDLFGNNSDQQYLINMYMLFEDLTDKTILNTFNDVNNYFKISLESGYLKIRSNREGTVTTATSRYLLDANKLYLMDFRVDPINPSNNVGFLYHPTGSVSILGVENFSAGMISSDQPSVFLGIEVSSGNKAAGLILSKFYYAPTVNLPLADTYKLQDPWSYIPTIKFQLIGGVGPIITIPDIWKSVLNDTKVTFIVPPTNLIAPGTYDAWIENYQGNHFNTKFGVIVKEFTKDEVGFDIDFTSGVFADKITAFKNTFYAFHSQWGGQNGGVNSDLIYFNPQNKSVVFESHGDNYTGEVQGVSKPAKDGTYTGYGVPKIHDIPADPKFSQPWKSRVGSIAVTQKYCGYGEWSTWMKVPKGAMGVCPALWFFHYQEISPADPRWQFWIDKGGKPYGGSESYMVINNEIDMELPSHITQAIFASWAELQLAYFDPKSLDLKTRVAVESGDSNADIGLFRLNNISAPNVKGSWVKESDTWRAFNNPSMSNCKFNNWVGEKSSGSGWAYEEANYAAEEYLALLTKLDHDYADGEFHKWTIKWFKNKTELWIDDTFIRENRGFVPYIPGRLTFGTWYPSGVTQSAEDYWKYSTSRAWAGFPADFTTINLEINRINFIPYDAATAGGENELFSESFPDAGLRIFV